MERWPERGTKEHLQMKLKTRKEQFVRADQCTSPIAEASLSQTLTWSIAPKLNFESLRSKNFGSHSTSDADDEHSPSVDSIGSRLGLLEIAGVLSQIVPRDLHHFSKKNTRSRFVERLTGLRSRRVERSDIKKTSGDKRYHGESIDTLNMLCCSFLGLSFLNRISQGHFSITISDGNRAKPLLNDVRLARLFMCTERLSIFENKQKPDHLNSQSREPNSQISFVARQVGPLEGKPSAANTADQFSGSDSEESVLRQFDASLPLTAFLEDEPVCEGPKIESDAPSLESIPLASTLVDGNAESEEASFLVSKNAQSKPIFQCLRESLGDPKNCPHYGSCLEDVCIRKSFLQNSPRQSSNPGAKLEFTSEEDGKPAAHYSHLGAFPVEHVAETQEDEGAIELTKMHQDQAEEKLRADFELKIHDTGPFGHPEKDEDHYWTAEVLKTETYDDSAPIDELKREEKDINHAIKTRVENLKSEFAEPITFRLKTLKLAEKSKHMKRKEREKFNNQNSTSQKCTPLQWFANGLENTLDKKQLRMIPRPILVKPRAKTMKRQRRSVTFRGEDSLRDYKSLSQQSSQKGFVRVVSAQKYFEQFFEAEN